MITNVGILLNGQNADKNPASWVPARILRSTVVLASKSCICLMSTPGCADLSPSLGRAHRCCMRDLCIRTSRSSSHCPSHLSLSSFSSTFQERSLAYSAIYMCRDFRQPFLFAFCPCPFERPAAEDGEQQASASCTSRERITYLSQNTPPTLPAGSRAQYRSGGHRRETCLVLIRRRKKRLDGSGRTTNVSEMFMRCCPDPRGSPEASMFASFAWLRMPMTGGRGRGILLLIQPIKLELSHLGSSDRRPHTVDRRMHGTTHGKQRRKGHRAVRERCGRYDPRVLWVLCVCM